MKSLDLAFYCSSHSLLHSEYLFSFWRWTVFCHLRFLFCIDNRVQLLECFVVWGYRLKLCICRSYATTKHFSSHGYLYSTEGILTRQVRYNVWNYVHNDDLCSLLPIYFCIIIWVGVWCITQIIIQPHFLKMKHETQSYMFCSACLKSFFLTQWQGLFINCSFKGIMEIYLTSE